MDKIVIEGGVRLAGRVDVLGAKNAALIVQCATLLGSGSSRLRALPRLADVETMNALLTELGCAVRWLGERDLSVDPAGVARGTLEAPYERVKTMRASVTVMGPLLARYGRARVSMPGGCAIGARPIDEHLRGLEALGARVTLDHGYVECESPRLQGARFRFDKVTVGGTQNVMMAATLARGATRLENCAREPEVADLAKALRSMGARIEGAGSSTIEVEGVDELSGADHVIMGDRIEAGTYAVAAAITRGDVLLAGAPAAGMGSTLEILRRAGVDITEEADGVRVRGPDHLRPLDVETAPHPGFPTDMQAQLMILCLLADGTSTLTETIFENRFMHVPELVRLGGDIRIKGHTAIVHGPRRLSGTTVMATDLRASASLVLAGLVADGTTEVRRVYHLDRGYERIEARLSALGARIERYHGARG
jgi:UDP-N-acetylglucosamine 1-carboxyvinyltransferase